MDSMMDAIKSYNPKKIQQLFENEQSACCPTKYSNDLILQWVRQTITDFNTR
jgi:hypothetical protein